MMVSESDSDIPSVSTGISSVSSGSGSSSVAVDSPASSERVFSISMVVSGIRCVLAYVVFPWALPAISMAGWIGSGFGLAVGVVAIVFNVGSIWRFWRVNHRYKWPITVINSGVIILLVIMMAADLSNIL